MPSTMPSCSSNPSCRSKPSGKLVDNMPARQPRENRSDNPLPRCLERSTMGTGNVEANYNITAGMLMSVGLAARARGKRRTRAGY